MMEKEHPCNICKEETCDGCIWEYRQSNECSRLECCFYRDFCTLGMADECRLSDVFEEED